MTFNETSNKRKAGYMRKAGFLALVAAALIALSPAQAAEQPRKSVAPQSRDNPLRELISGYYFNPLALRSLQDDDFDNPGFVWPAQGEKLWNQPDGVMGKSCASCHLGDAMRGKAATYPRYDEAAGKVVSLEQRINMCRDDKMKASPWPHESDALLAVTAFIRLQSRQLLTNVTIDGPAAQTFATGKKLYYQRIGQYGMTCAQCHNERYGASLGGETLSQGHPNGAPAYRVPMQKLTSLHERFRECYRLMRAEPYAAGSPEYVALELYLNWRANGLPLEAPAVRH